MKKKLLWALTLVLFALFPYQNAKASLVQLDRSGWTVTASSEETSGEGTYRGYASNIKDGNTNSFWHSRYTGGNAAKPHWIMVNLGSVQTIDAFNYVARMANITGCNGNIENYKLYISTSAPTTTNISGTMQEVASGEFSYTGSNTEHLITLNNSVEAQYVLLYAVSTHGSIDDTFANCSEFYLYKKDYCTSFPASSTRTDGNRNLVSLNFNDANNTNTAIAVNQASTSGAQIYFDKTSSVITLTKGAEVTPVINWNGWAMHSYLYVDWDGDKDFTPNLGTNGVPAEDSEIIAYSYYNGRNHKGESVGESTDAAYPKNMKNFTIPESIPTGEYRARYMILWSKMDPCTICNTDHHPVVVDFTIKIEDSTPSNEKKQNLFSSANISQANNIYPYRIPGIAKAYNNDLIAVAAHLICGTDPGYGQVDVVCRVSKDNGVTWGDEVDVAVGDASLINANTNVFEIAFGDPAIVADRTSNKVAIFVVAGCTHYLSATRQNPNMIGVIYGTYNQNTEEWDWEEPENITEDIYSLFDSGSQIQSAFIAGGKVFQSRIVKNGDYYRLYAAINARPGGNRVVYSDDFGRTWHALGGAFAQP
ncbi:MAG: discoidin domain-containing protein, partial [Bacteroidaceae bacterium]|nr:discoidin domain-containing protein [Bacteroidaceae bacterium]